MNYINEYCAQTLCGKLVKPTAPHATTIDLGFLLHSIEVGVDYSVKNDGSQKATLVVLLLGITSLRVKKCLRFS